MTRSELKAAAERQYRQRRLRDRVFNHPELFGEPAWDILLDLYAAHIDGRTVYVSSACIAASVPQTTALRYLTRLEQLALVARRADRNDNRRVIVSLTGHAIELIERSLINGRSHSSTGQP